MHVHRLDHFAALLAGRDVRLVGDDHVQETAFAQALERSRNLRKNLELFQAVRRIRLGVADAGAGCGTRAVDGERPPQPPADPPLTSTPSPCPAFITYH